MEDSMETLVNKIDEKQQLLAKEMATFQVKGNKAAGRRARKLSLELEKLYKEFRKESV